MWSSFPHDRRVLSGSQRNGLTYDRYSNSSPTLFTFWFLKFCQKSDPLADASWFNFNVVRAELSLLEFFEEANGSSREPPKVSKERGHFLRFRLHFCSFAIFQYAPYVLRGLGCVMVRLCLFEFLRLRHLKDGFLACTQNCSFCHYMHYYCTLHSLDSLSLRRPDKITDAIIQPRIKLPFSD